MQSCPHCKALIPPESLFFCPDCGQTITTLGGRMITDGKMRRVGIKAQILLSITPFLGCMSGLRVKKMKKSLLIYFCCMFGSFFIVGVVLTVFRESPLLAFPVGILIILLASWATASVIMVHFAIKWSLRWNKLITLIDQMQ